MTTTSEVLLVDIKDHVATLTMNRPDRLNALSPDLMVALAETMAKLAEDKEVRCVVLTGAGRGFCAGGDIGNMMTGDASAAAQDPVARIRDYEETSRLLHEMPKPTIAAVNGAAAGAGLSIALCCDIRFAGESAKFGTAFVRVGFSGDFGGTWMLQRLVGPAKARELYFTGDLIDAREAERLGLVNRVLPDDKLMEETGAFALKLAQGPPLALARMKANMNLGLKSDLPALLDAEAEGMAYTGTTQDNREALRAFMEKRAPTFHGR